MSRYFEEFKIGDRFRTPAMTITEAAVTTMIGLAGLTSPLFVDEVYAKGTPFGTRIVPGRVTLLFMGGLEERLGLYDETVIALIGFDNIRFKAPLKAGDTIHVNMEIISLKETSKQDRGIVIHRSTCLNQRHETLLENDTTHIIKRRIEV
jgi:acyl dehydratase